MQRMDAGHLAAAADSGVHRQTFLRAVLAEPTTLGRLHSIVGRRVPVQAVADVVHQTVCEALAAEDPPLHPDKARRWLFGIARHKVADFHRARHRSAVAPGIDPEQLASPAPSLEARSLLRGILADATRDPRGAETMEWIAREAGGEPLEELAREAALPAATVRQRVSRLRRWLRKRWGREALMVAAVSLLSLALALAPRRGAGPIAMYPDPAGDTAAAARIVLQGSWHVVSVTPDAALSPAHRALVDQGALAATAQIDGDELRLQSPGNSVTLHLAVGPVVSGRFEVHFGGAQSGPAAVVRVDDQGRLVVAGTGDWRGTMVLAR
jgi:DNA-directed RNA polymerase specialized sigma24 family protein